MHPLYFVGGHAHSTYALLLVLSYASGILWLRTQVKTLESTPRIFWALVATVVGSALLGGKLGFYLVEWRAFSADPLGMLGDWGGGWVFWTGLLSGFAAGLGFQAWYNNTHKPRLYLPVGDYCIAALAIGHVIGRIGCFLEGCCHGRPTSLWWGVRFTDPASSVDPSLLGVPLHPTQLIEAGFEACAAAALILWILPAIARGRLRRGTAFIGYTLYYAVMRFAVETLRGDDRGVLLSTALSPSQWISLAAAAVAGYALWTRGVRSPGGKPGPLYT